MSQCSKNNKKPLKEMRVSSPKPIIVQSNRYFRTNLKSSSNCQRGATKGRCRRSARRQTKRTRLQWSARHLLHHQSAASNEIRSNMSFTRENELAGRFVPSQHFALFFFPVRHAGVEQRAAMVSAGRNDWTNHRRCRRKWFRSVRT